MRITNSFSSLLTEVFCCATITPYCLDIIFLLMVFLISTIHYSLFTAFALEVPALKGYVNDYAGMMSQETRLKIENELKAFEQSDSTQIVILTIPSLEGEVLEGVLHKGRGSMEDRTKRKR